MRILTTLMLSLTAFSAQASTVGGDLPEPGTLVLLGLAAVAGLVAHKRRK